MYTRSHLCNHLFLVVYFFNFEKAGVMCNWERKKKEVEESLFLFFRIEDTQTFILILKSYVILRFAFLK